VGSEQFSAVIYRRRLPGGKAATKFNRPPF
jgi:hypothetical protein